MGRLQRQPCSSTAIIVFYKLQLMSLRVWEKGFGRGRNCSRTITVGIQRTATNTTAHHRHYRDRKQNL